MEEIGSREKRCDKHNIVIILRDRYVTSLTNDERRLWTSQTRNQWPPTPVRQQK